MFAKFVTTSSVGYFLVLIRTPYLDIDDGVLFYFPLFILKYFSTFYGTFQAIFVLTRTFHRSIVYLSSKDKRKGAGKTSVQGERAKGRSRAVRYVG